MKKNIVTALVISIIVLISCKKNNEKSCNLSESSFIGTFKTKSVIYKSNASDPGYDMFLSWDDCQKDDLMVIYSSHTILYQDAGTLCYPGGNATGTWTLSGNAVVVDGQAGTVTYFDCNNTVISYPQGTTNATITLSLVRQ
jgi:hypothetical protein